MRNQIFNFEIEGRNVTPQTVSARDLFDLISNLESACAVTAKGSGAKESDDLFVSIIGINSGSDKLTIAVSDRMFKAAGKISRAIARNDFREIPTPAHGKIRALWKKAHNAEWTLSFRSDGNGIAEASIVPDHEILRPGAMDGRTTLYGVAERVGGADRQTLQILLLSGERCTIEIKSKELAEEIGKHLHRVIGLEGDATWDIDSWTLSNFKATDYVEYRDSSPNEAFKALYEVSNGLWDGLNENEYMNEIRSE